MTGQQPDGPKHSGWWIAAAAVPILCCAGPALLTALGVSGLGAVVGGATGNLALAAFGVCAAGVAVLLLLRRSGRRQANAREGRDGTGEASPAEPGQGDTRREIL